MMSNERAEVRVRTRSEAETEAVGAALAQQLSAGAVVTLEGDLGAGKTVFCRGVIRGLGHREGYVTSPTFAIANPYPGGRLPVWHLDLYRLAGPDELLAIGAEEWLGGEGVALVEWPERGDGVLPADRLEVRLGFVPESPEEREIVIAGAVAGLAEAYGRRATE